MKTQVPRVLLPIVYSCLISAILFPSFSSGSLTYGFYNTICPDVETTVRNAIYSALNGYNGAAASLVRLQFHDCFVAGCDASILLDESPENPFPEKNEVFKMREFGFDLIDIAKAAVELICPGVVSCADIIAFAARDAINLLGGFSYAVPAGRRDGTVSSLFEAFRYLPPPTANLTQLVSTFAVKGFSLDELITLSGAHSFGESHCSSFENRLYPSYDPNQIDPGFAQMLRGKCPEDAITDGIVAQDFKTPNVLDVKYYDNVLHKKVLFFSDYALSTDPGAVLTMTLYSTDNLLNVFWRPNFIAAMQKLGQVEVLTGTQGQIRTNCRRIN